MTNNLDTTRSQTFTYDQLNRIVSGQTTSTYATSPAHCWGEAFGVDPWGNLQSIAATTTSGAEVIADFPEGYIIEEFCLSIDKHDQEMLDFWAFRRASKSH